MIGAPGIVWALDLFNFTDGIDRIAASEGIFVALAGALLSFVTRGGSSFAFAALVLAAAWGGFCCGTGRPPCIFGSDVGSGYLGYVIAVLAVAATRANPAAVWAWLILGGVFFVDATVALLRRLARSERLHQAHRSHVYQ